MLFTFLERRTGRQKTLNSMVANIPEI
jgi:hypothetical protein